MAFGRVGYCGSIDRGRDEINDARVIVDVISVAKLCHDHSLDLVVGIGVSRDSIDCIREIRQVHLTRFETRKVAFCAHALNSGAIATGLLNALHFELLCLLNERDCYGSIEREGSKRTEMLDSCW